MNDRPLRRPAGLSLWKICRLIRDEIVLTFGTASGEVVLPRLIAWAASHLADVAAWPLFYNVAALLVTGDGKSVLVGAGWDLRLLELPK